MLLITEVSVIVFMITVFASFVTFFLEIKSFVKIVLITISLLLERSF